jgi:hypothetical protein
MTAKQRSRSKERDDDEVLKLCSLDKGTKLFLEIGLARK